MTENKRFELRLCSNGTYYVYENGVLTDVDFDKFNKESAYALIDKVNALYEEKEQLKSTIAQLIEQNRKNNDLLQSDIRILEKALWCGGCENDYGRLKELRKEFMR